jgi:hypothetical protein
MHWKDLKVWQKAHELVIRVYRVSARFPKAEMYGITSQIRRAAASYESLESEYEQVSRMLNGLITSLRTNL